ncbi:4'-phosphopantetheinyl transferase superfamily protein [Zavarzinia sp.]|uniref:4'-phosphopantetheinyl transferase superfamily protein n=1 Tax=Zavarzinia sp. TaxID=2027920 RepID=UPI0035652B09
MADAEVHVWLVDLQLTDNIVEDFDFVASSAEKSRAARFRREDDRRRFRRARSALRRILACYTRQAPEKIDIMADENGRPRLRQTGEIDFNCSRTGGFALIAIGRNCRVGVDVERVQSGFPAMELAQVHFSRAEAEELSKQSEFRRIPAFFRCWTAKEACVKAWGMGLSLPLADFDVAEDADGSPRLAARRAALSPLWLHLLPTPARLTAVLAADRPLAAVQTTFHSFARLAALGPAGRA